MSIKFDLSFLSRFLILIHLICGILYASQTNTVYNSVVVSYVQQLPTANAKPKTVCDKSLLKPGNWHDMFYHGKMKKTLLVNGGPEEGKSSKDPLEIWEWNGACWALLSASLDGPLWRNFASISYDSTRGVLVLYGGLQSQSVQFEETWEWDGKNWKRFDAKGPGIREAAGMTYDAKRRQTILFGGSQGEKAMADTWTWNGTNWTLVSETGPAGRFPAGFVYDSAREVTMLFGGHRFNSNGVEMFGDTWIWDGKAWRQIATTSVAAPAPRDGARAVFDARRKQVLLFGGIEISTTVKYFNDIWSWNGTKWSEIKVVAPPGRGHHTMAYDAARDRVLLFGGARKMGEILNDTWEWDGSKWVCVDGCKK